MGATWCMWLQNTAIKKRTTKLNEQRDTIFRQILYDLTMWDSIANEDKKTRYVPAHTAGFIKTYKLRNTETVDNDAPFSSDDEAPGDAPLDHTATEREALRAAAQAALQAEHDASV